MSEKRKEIEVLTDLALQPAEYEIRIKGRLDSGYWAEWFDNMTVAVEEDGITVLRGPITDQAALYGILSRLRDLAVPLLSVSRVETEEYGGTPPFSVRSGKPRRKINWLLIAVYLLLAGGLSALTVFLTSEGVLHTALALGLLFGALGGIAYAFFARDGGVGWLIASVVGGLAAVLVLGLYLILAGWLHPALGIALLLLLPAGGLLYLLFWRKEVSTRSVNAPVQWEPLGQRSYDKLEGTAKDDPERRR